MDIEESTNAYGRHIRDHVIIYLRTQYRAWKDEELLITHITKTIAHEELHIILRRIGIGYTTNEEEVFRRLQHYLYPELYLNKAKTMNNEIKQQRDEKALKDIRNVLNGWESVENSLSARIKIDSILKLRSF